MNRNIKILSLSIFLALIYFSSYSQVEKWTPEFQMKFKTLAQTDISTDGKYVAYIVREPLMEGEKSEYLSQVWVAATDGSFNLQYTRGEKSSTSPKFSPDGQKIAFLSSRSGKSQVWMMRLMGGEAEQLTDVKSGAGSFQWSPDGQSIIFLQTDPMTEEEEKEKKEKRDVILVDKDYKFTHLYKVETEGSKTVKQLTAGDLVIQSFDISPDGSEILFSFGYEPTINSSFLESDISKVSSDSGAIEVVIKRPGNDDTPYYAPDGKSFVFATTNGKSEPIGLSDMSIYNFRNDKITELPKTPDRNVSILGWSQDGKQIYFSEAYKTSFALMAMDVPGGGRSAEKEFKLNKNTLLTDNSGISTAISISEGGVASYVFQDPNKPAEIFVKDLKSGEKKQLSNINGSIEVPSMGKTELISWKSPDGMEVEGLLTYPVDYEKGKKYPIILNVHGGPAGVFVKSFTGGPGIYMVQTFAQKGYLVLRPNPRGSTGYGKEFRYANFQDWGFGDFEDLVTGVDKLIEMGIADEKNQFLMGWSYGGYMTSYAVTKTDRFNAASMGAGLPNLISMTTTTDIPDYLVGHMGDEFWENYEIYEKHSAMYRIKNVTTPTQVIHGANDLRVPFTQGQEFYVALKRLGVDTEMIVYPRTPHGPTEPKFLMDVSGRIIDWFEKYKAE